MIELLRTNTPRSIAIFSLVFGAVFIPQFFLQDVSFASFLSFTVLSYIAAYFLNFILHKYQLLEERSYLPALIFILFVPKAISTAAIFSLISLCFCLWVLELVFSFQDNKLTDRKLFDGGFICGMSFLFNPFSVAILIFPVLGMVYFARLKIRQVILLLTAFVIPILLLLELNYLSDSSFLVSKWAEAETISSEFFTLSATMSFSSLLFVFVFGLLAFFKSMAKSKVSIRSGVRLIVLFSVVAASMLFIPSSGYEQAILFFGVPFGWYTTNYLLLFRREWLANLMLLALLVFFLYRDHLYLF